MHLCSNEITVVTTRNILVPNMSFRNKGHERLCTNNQSSRKWIILGTVTLKSWFLDPGIIKQNIRFRTPLIIHLHRN